MHLTVFICVDEVCFSAGRRASRALPDSADETRGIPDVPHAANEVTSPKCTEGSGVGFIKEPPVVDGAGIVSCVRIIHLQQFHGHKLSAVMSRLHFTPRRKVELRCDRTLKSPFSKMRRRSMGPRGSADHF